MIVKVERATRNRGTISFNAKREVRLVSIPDDEVGNPDNIENVLDLVMKYGQNEVQPRKFSQSVALDDVIVYRGRRWLIIPKGFQELRA